VNDLADVLAQSDLRGVAASFDGSWEDAVSGSPRWELRFPRAYNLCFEVCIDGLIQFSNEHWNSEPIALVFSQQDEYARRAMEIGDTMKYNGQWPSIASMTYADPALFPQLQAADMIAHETFKFLTDGRGEAWRGLPLLGRLFPKQMASGTTLFDGHYDKVSFRETMEMSDLNPYLKKVPSCS
jgi:hypothetical protein